MRLAARLLTGFALAAALALAARAAMGPFSIGGVRVASPMGLESFCACALVALWLTGPDSKTRTPEWKLPPGIALWVALGVVALAYAPNLADPFLSDDYILAARSTLEPARLIALFHTPGGDGSFRPIGYLYFGLVRGLFGANSLAWHSVALGIHLVNCALLFAIVRRLWNRPALAALAALFFGVHGSRPESVAWSAGNFDLLACGFALAATFFALRGQASANTFAACAFAALAILSKESAYATPALMLGLAAAANRSHEARASIFGTVAVCAAMFAWRWSMFHGPGGYVDRATGQAQILSFHLGSALKGLLLRVWALMAFPIDWDAFTRSVPLALAILAAVAAFTLATPPARRTTVALLATTVGLLLPAYHLALIGPDLNGSRILYLPAAGFCVLCAHLMNGRRLAAVALAVGSIVMLRVNLAAWHEDAVLADQVCAGTTTQAPVHDRKGVVFFANGYAECRELKGR